MGRRAAREPRLFCPLKSLTIIGVRQEAIVGCMSFGSAPRSGIIGYTNLRKGGTWSMPVDYETIRRENRVFYGSGIASFGQPLLADAYGDRTHFILELLQNAEDALRRRERGWEGSRIVSFHLTQTSLRISHCGDPFNERDVRGICGIAESGKQGSLTDIGRFGMGFKSVYAFTDCPEVYSGPEAFAIESFVWPKAVPQIRDKDPDETVFKLPLQSNDPSGHDDISSGLRGLGPRTLLFLRHIEEIEWEVEDGGSGCYLRETNCVDDDVRRVTVIGQAAGEDDAAEEWLVFSRAVCHDENPAGWVEIAFKINPDDPERERGSANPGRVASCGVLPHGARHSSWLSHAGTVPDHAKPRQRSVR